MVGAAGARDLHLPTGARKQIPMDPEDKETVGCLLRVGCSPKDFVVMLPNG